MDPPAPFFYDQWSQEAGYYYPPSPWSAIHYPAAPLLSSRSSSITSHRQEAAAESGRSEEQGSLMDPSNKENEQESERPHYSYFVRIINPKKKSDYTVRTWHDVKHPFESIVSLKAKLVESFPSDLPNNLSFQIGYFEGRGSTKRWIVEVRDLHTMYLGVEVGSKITLWCEGKATQNESDPPPSKKSRTEGNTRRELLEGEVDIFKQLKEKHPDLAAPKLRLWVRLIHSGRHEDYDNPPNIPLITGSPSAAKPRKDSITDALTGAATAVVKMLQAKDSSETPQARAKPTSTYISPMKVAQLRRSCLDDLKKVKELLEDGVLTEQEFADEKQMILSSLKTLK